MAVITILLAFLACAATSLALGLLAVRALRIDLSRAECVCLGYVMGSALASMLTLTLAALSLAREAVFVALGLAAVVALGRLLPWLRGLKQGSLESIPAFLRWAFAASWMVYGVIYFRYALAPERSFDGMAYHLGLVNLWNHAHGMYRIADIYAALPQGIEMLFLFAFSIGRHSAAALMHFSFLMLLPLLMILYGIRFRIPRGAAVCAAILMFVTPLVGWDGSVAYNDVALAAAVFASVYLLELWRCEKRSGYLAAAAFLAGFAFAIKYTGGFLLVLVAGAVIWELRREERKLRTLLIAAVAMALMPAPYLVRNWVWYQNPIAFFGNSIFRNRNFHVSLEAEFIRDQMHFDGVAWRELPRELTIGAKFGQNLGAVYFLAPVALLGLLWPKSRILVIAAAVVGLAYPGNIAPRFLIPILPFILLAMASVLSRLPGSVWVLGALSVAQFVSSLPPVTKLTHHPAIPYPGFDQVSWKIALRREPEEEYLAHEFEAYQMSRAIDHLVPAGDKVLALFGGFLQSYTSHFVMNESQSGEAEIARDALYSNRESATDGRRRFTVVFPETRARQLLILQTATDSHIWSITEIQMWHGNERIAPPNTANLDAFPNPWDIGRAFDGLEASRWRAWERMRPGQRIVVRFPSPQPIDRVDLLANDFQWFSRMDLRLLSEKGEWLCPLTADWVYDPPRDLRREAAEALQRQGVRYLLISRDAAFPEIFRNHPQAWNLRELASTKEATLYRIE